MTLLQKKLSFLCQVATSSLGTFTLLALLAFGPLSVVLTPHAHGQVLTGEIDGTVHDQSGALVPQATVTITNTEKGLTERVIKSNTEGQFSAPLLSIGTYSLKISAPGFETYTVTDITVNVGEPTTVPIKLSVGENSVSITVNAAEVTTQLDSAASGTLIGPEQVTELPLSDRNYLQLLDIQPGISSAGVPGLNERGNIKSNGAVNTQSFSVNGNGTSANGFYLDGADTLKRAGQQPVSFPGIDFIQEVNLQRGQYGAEFGGPGAAVVSVQTKAGTSSFHGGAFAFFRSQIFDANDYFNNRAGVPRGLLRYADYGYYLGGPVWIPKLFHRGASKTFFFFGQEYLRSAESTQETVNNLPTVAERSGDFTGAQICLAYNAANKCTQLATSVTNIDPTAQEYLTDVISKLPVPNNPSDIHGYIGNSTGNNNETQTIIRIDHQFSSNLSGFFRYLDDPFHLVVPDGFQRTSIIPGVARSRMTDGSTNWLGDLTYVLGSNHVFELGYSRRQNWVTAQAIGTLSADVSKDIHVQLPYVSTLNQVPHINIGGSNYAVTSPYDERSPVTQIFLNNTNTLGRHTLVAGFNVELQQGGGNNAGANAGTFNFVTSPHPTGMPGQGLAIDQAFANFLLGKASTFTQASIDAAGANHSNIYEGYVQDKYRATARLTATLGVRYTYYESPTGATLPGHAASPVLNFDPATFNPAHVATIDSNGLICTTAPCAGGGTPNNAYDPLNGIIQGGLNSPYGDGVAHSPRNNIAPRFGFTYDLFGNGATALRGGYGIYFIAIPANQAKAATNQDPPNVYTTTISNTSFGNPGNGIPQLNAAPSNLQAFAVNSPLPYTEQYSLDLQQQLRRGIVLDIGYYGNHGLHQFATVDLNQPREGAYRQLAPFNTAVNINAGNTQVLNQIRPYLGYEAIPTQLNDFKSNYNSLQVILRGRMSKHTIFNVNYTWSKALTNARTPQNNADLAPEYGRSNLNRTNVFHASFVYELPFYATQRGFTGKLLGGYAVTGIINYATGQYETPITGATDPGGLGLLVGPATARPDIVGDPNQHAPHTFAQWFNSNAFAPTPASQNRAGNAPVADILGPGYGIVNMSVIKNLPLKHQFNFQIRVEAFNVFNHTNFQTINTNFTATNYGQVTDTGDPRRLQLGAKLTF